MKDSLPPPRTLIKLPLPYEWYWPMWALRSGLLGPTIRQLRCAYQHHIQPEAQPVRNSCSTTPGHKALGSSSRWDSRSPASTCRRCSWWVDRNIRTGQLHCPTGEAWPCRTLLCSTNQRCSYRTGRWGHQLWGGEQRYTVLMKESHSIIISWILQNE